MVEMKALKGFTNKAIYEGGPRGDGTVLPGEEFLTSWLHAKELHFSGLAQATDPGEFDKEPADVVDPSNQLSVTEHAAINARRKAGAEKVADKAK